MMKRIEKTLVALAVLGLLMEVVRIEGGFFFTFIALLALTAQYLIFTFALLNNISFLKIFAKESYSEISLIRMIFSLGCGFIFSSVCVGLLFMIFRYEGREIQLAVPLIPLTIVLVFSAIQFRRSTDRRFFLEVLTRGVAMVISGLLSFMFL